MKKVLVLIILVAMISIFVGCNQTGQTTEDYIVLECMNQLALKDYVCTLDLVYEEEDVKLYILVVDGIGVYSVGVRGTEVDVETKIL